MCTIWIFFHTNWGGIESFGRSRPWRGALKYFFGCGGSINLRQFWQFRDFAVYLALPFQIRPLLYHGSSNPAPSFPCAGRKGESYYSRLTRQSIDLQASGPNFGINQVEIFLIDPANANGSLSYSIYTLVRPFGPVWTVSIVGFHWVGKWAGYQLCRSARTYTDTDTLALHTHTHKPLGCGVMQTGKKQTSARQNRFSHSLCPDASVGEGDGQWHQIPSFVRHYGYIATNLNNIKWMARVVLDRYSIQSVREIRYVYTQPYWYKSNWCKSGVVNIYLFSLLFTHRSHTQPLHLFDFVFSLSRCFVQPNLCLDADELFLFAVCLFICQSLRCGTGVSGLKSFKTRPPSFFWPHVRSSEPEFSSGSSIMNKNRVRRRRRPFPLGKRGVIDTISFALFSCVFISTSFFLWLSNVELLMPLTSNRDWHRWNKSFHSPTKEKKKRYSEKEGETQFENQKASETSREVGVAWINKNQAQERKAIRKKSNAAQQLVNQDRFDNCYLVLSFSICSQRSVF